MPKKQNNNMHFLDLRKKYAVFTFNDYFVNIENQKINIEFDFNISGKFYFRPSYQIELKSDFINAILQDESLNILVFHIGLIEMISYWKATCSPKIIINAGKLLPDQVQFLEKIFYKGLGEFRYLNGIKVTQDQFVDFEYEEAHAPANIRLETENKYLVPVGGGKDSVVSLELLKKIGGEVIPFALNPSVAIKETIKNAGFNSDDTIVFKRKLDKKLLELNERGFLNGHTPFSALLAFNTLLAAALKGSKWVALSNESSANEPTVPGTDINHQYSKSLEFENDFRNYCTQYISSDIQYFSLLRPLNELQIAALFSKLPQHFHSFRSCNVGSKENRWCCACPKCLFVYIILSPFVSKEKLLKIFGKDLLDEKDLKNTFDELAGISDVKPFECIGTIDEVNTSLCRIIEKCDGEDLPELLKYYAGLSIYKEYKKSEFVESLSNIYDDHNVDKDILQLIQDELNELETQ